MNGKPVLLLIALAHPDLLPPVYAMAQVFRDEGYYVYIVCSDAPVKSVLDPGPDIALITCGAYTMNASFAQRSKVRKRIKTESVRIIQSGAIAVISYCVFSFLLGLKIKKHLPVLYMALETAEYSREKLLRAPFSDIRNRLAFRRLKKAALIATPSIQRSAWVAGMGNLNFVPHAIHNTAYINKPAQQQAQDIRDLIPAHFSDKHIFLYTGNVTVTYGVLDLVKAYDQIANEKSSLIITGMRNDEYSAAIKDFVNKSPNRDSILLLPWVAYSQALLLQSAAHIGICITRETGTIESCLIAPNKAGEYLANGLLLIGSNVFYMKYIETHGAAVLTPSLEIKDIAATMQTALAMVNDGAYKERVKEFVQNEFNMKAQAQPVIDYLKTLKK